MKAVVDDFKAVLTRKERFTFVTKAVVFLVIFAAGVVAGLWTATGHRRCCNTYTSILFPSNTVYRYRGGGGGGGSFGEFVAPTRLMHDMTDEQLFWRATMSPASAGGEYPFQRVPKVAFMFLAGRGVLPLAPLWERFFRGHEGLFSVYVHAPPGVVINVSDDSPFYGRQIPSQETKWGSITLMDAEKRLLANALLDFSNERFVLLSESCIPVQSFPTVYDYLTGSRHSFVEVYYHKDKTCRGRYSHRMEPDITLPQWRKGSQWFELSRGLAVSVLADTRYYPLFRQHCLPSCYPDEHYLPTLVTMLHGAANSNRTVTYVDWSRGGAHPVTYAAGDVTPDLIQSLRRSETPCMYNSRPTTACFLFARKFSPDALEPLLNMSSTVMQY
ncbi:glycosyltransferase BC10-like [Oryza brachyantha]|nr:glycosyltransferase BC10-like [Oryza brachyantha]